MITRSLAVIVGLALVAIAILFWRPELLGHGLDISLGAFDAWRAGLAAAVACCGMGIAVAVWIPERELKSGPTQAPLLAGADRGKPDLGRAEVSDSGVIAFPAGGRRAQAAPDDLGLSPAACTAGLIAASVAAAEASPSPVTPLAPPTSKQPTYTVRFIDAAARPSASRRRRG